MEPRPFDIDVWIEDCLTDDDDYAEVDAAELFDLDDMPQSPPA